MVSSYNDANTGGNSMDSFVYTDSTVVFKFIVGNQLQFPYTGIRFKKKSKTPIDLSSFNQIRFKVRAGKSRLIPINLSLNDYELTNGKKTTIILHTKLHYSPDKDVYTLPLNDFTVPSWWLVINKITAADIGDYNLKAISSIDIQCGELLPQNTSDQIELYDISFLNDPKKVIETISIVVLALDLLLFLVYLFRLKYTVQLVPVPYQSQEVENIADSDIQKIQAYISANYSDPITTSTIQQETGISKTKIPTLLKTHLNTTLKQLLLTIRINEAKRLLKESDLPVNSIADKVGFGHVSHFNRVFKDVEGKTPLEFRKS